MSDSSGIKSDTSLFEVTGKVLVVAIVVLMFVVVAAFAIHLYSKWIWRRRGQENTDNTRRTEIARPLHKGVDPSVLKTIPIVVFDPKDESFKDGLECAVCLSELCEGEKARLLPKCNHGFHVECIDMWFESHSNCPICRTTLLDESQLSESTVQIPPTEVDGGSAEPLNLPTNVLFWGDETQVSNSGRCLEDVRGAAAPSSSSSSSCPDGMLVIDIPRHIHEEEEQESPIMTRLRSLHRLLSGNRRVNPSSPRSIDLESQS